MQSGVFTMKFKTFEAAQHFVTKAGAMAGTAKPYKRMMWIDGQNLPIWCVSMPAPKAAA